MFGIERRKVLPWSEVNPLQIAYSTNHEPPIHKEGLEIVRYPRFVIVWSSSKRGSDFTVNLESGEMKSLAGAAAEFREEEVVIGY